MILSYIRSAHRNVVRNKVQSFIQILSLAIGLTVFTLISFYLYDELTIDRSNPVLNQVYRMEEKSAFSHGEDILSIGMGPVILDSVPEVSHMTRVSTQWNALVRYVGENEKEERHILLNNYMDVDSGFQEVFPQEYLLGDPDGLFKKRGGIVLTESVSNILFDGNNPIGKTVLLWGGSPRTVTGVIRDPVNTHLKFEALCALPDWYEFMAKKGRVGSINDIYSYGMPSYVRLHQGANVQEIEKKMASSWNAFLNKAFASDERITESIYLRSLKEVPFAGIDPYKGYLNQVNRKKLMNLFYMSLAILLLGMINYTNLTTARAARRQKEMAMRKINGASRKSIILYLLTDSVITTFFSFLLALTLVQLLFTKFSHLLKAEINLYFLGSPLTWILSLLALLLIGALAGFYPALRISSESPLAMFKGESGRRGIGIYTRRILMILQFSSAVILLVLIFTMKGQIQFMQSQDLGFNTKQVAHMGTGGNSSQDRLDLRSRLLTIPEVEVVSFAHDLPGNNLTEDIQVVNDPESLFHGLELKLVPAADPDFFEVFDLRFTHGGEMLDQSLLDSVFNVQAELMPAPYYVINESCRKALKLEDPVGLHFEFMGRKSIIVGVIEDYHFQSLKHSVKPQAIRLNYEGLGWMCSVKINSNNIPLTIDQIQKAYHGADTLESTGKGKTHPKNPHDIFFIDESFAMQYEEEERIQAASLYVSIMAVIIACLGLFGLSTFMAQRRVKEMGIRRAMGASEKAVFKLLAKDFLKWVSVSVFIGLPIGYLLSKQWQQQFAHKASLDISIYVLTVFLVIVVTLSTVTWQSLRASRASPVDSLRSD